MSFETEGYALRPLFAPALIASLQAAVLAHIDRVAGALYLPFDHSEPNAPLAERLDRIAARDPSYANLLRIAACTDAHRAPSFAALATHAALGSCIREFLGGEPEALIMRLRANISSLTAERERWHSDVALMDGSACSRVRLTCWIPLMDAGPDSGGLELVVGRRSSPLPHAHNAGRFEISEADLPDSPRVQPYCPAGSVVFLDRYTPHRALPNHSGGARWSLVVWVRAPATDAERPDERRAA
jgi:ectoine hydroxylase-related dioxygenase (phytanoyl-CoA dioxygenase family)